jgi:glycosyltransferase involved in cell wall biosynthesis
MQTSQQGINIVGYTEGTFGLAEAVRLNIAAARKYDIPLNLINYEKVRKDTKYQYALPYQVNLVQIALHDLESFFTVIDPNFFKGRYSVLFLVWESEYIAPELTENLHLFNEIWTTSQYCKKIFEKVFKNPIIIVPHPVEVQLEPIEKPQTIQVFDQNKFSFLFLFSYHSSVERKNPHFLIEAFKNAFNPNDNVELIIKTVGGQQFKKERRKLEYNLPKNIKIYDIELPKNDVNHLIASCDAYVSLHHSEGFGLSLAEAMYLGKPVVATNYSGNTEFMNEENSFPVNYQLSTIKESDGLFCTKTIWADPLLPHAIDQLKNVYENAGLRKLKANNASFYVKDKLSFSSIGAIMSERTEYLYENMENLILPESQSAYFINKLQSAKVENQILKREIRKMKKNVIIRTVLFIKDRIKRKRSQQSQRVSTILVRDSY